MPNSDSPSLLLGAASAFTMRLPGLSRTMGRNSSYLSLTERFSLEHYLQEFCQQLRSDLRLGLPYEEANSIQENKIKHYQAHLKKAIDKKLETYNYYFYPLNERKIISELFSLLSTLQTLQKLSQDPRLPKFSCGLSFSKNSKKNPDKIIIKIIAKDLKKSEKLAKKNANEIFAGFRRCMTRLPRIQEEIVGLILPKNYDTSRFYLLEVWLTEFALSLKKGDLTDSKIFYNTLRRLQRVREAASAANKNQSESNDSITSQTNLSFESQSSVYTSSYNGIKKVDNAYAEGQGKYALGRSSFFKPPVYLITTKPAISNRINIVKSTLKRSASI